MYVDSSAAVSTKLPAVSTKLPAVSPSYQLLSVCLGVPCKWAGSCWLLVGPPRGDPLWPSGSPHIQCSTRHIAYHSGHRGRPEGSRGHGKLRMCVRMHQDHVGKTIGDRQLICTLWMGVALPAPPPPLSLPTSGDMKATVPCMSLRNSPAPVTWAARRAAAPKSATLTLWPVESTNTLAPTYNKAQRVAFTSSKHAKTTCKTRSRPGQDQVKTRWLVKREFKFYNSALETFAE